MSEKLSKSVEQQATIRVPQDGVTVQLLSHYLSILAEDIMVPSMDMLKSVPPGVPRLRLSIIVSAIGEQPIRESLISAMQHGESSPTDPSAPDSSMSPSVAQMEARSTMETRWADRVNPSSPTQRSRAGGEYHRFKQHPYGIGPKRDENCNTCGMPRTAFQHQRE